MRFLCNLSLCVCLLFLSVNFSGSWAQDKSEKIKAVFLFKFASYFTWPEGNSLTICTYGKDPFQGLLGKLQRKNKKISIKNIKTGKSIKGCSIAYVPRSVAMPSIKGKSILLVGESVDFARKGGIVEMREENNKIKLIINIAELKRANLKASSRILDISEVIR